MTKPHDVKACLVDVDGSLRVLARDGTAREIVEGDNKTGRTVYLRSGIEHHAGQDVMIYRWNRHEPGA